MNSKSLLKENFLRRSLIGSAWYLLAPKLLLSTRPSRHLFGSILTGSKLIQSLILCVSLLGSSLALAGGQSTVIGRRADYFITYFAYYHQGALEIWPSGLVARIDYRLLRTDSEPITYPDYDDAHDDPYVPLLVDLIDALEYGHWFRAARIRLQIQRLEDLDASQKNPPGCGH